MKEKKSTILFIIGITLGILIGACAIYFTIGNNQKNIKDNSKTKAKNDEIQYETFNYDLEGKDGACMDLELIYASPLYDQLALTAIKITNLGINKDTIVYEEPYKKIFINDVKIFEQEPSQGVLEKVCSYNGYLLYSGFETYGIDDDITIVKNNEVVYKAIGFYEEQNDNQLMFFETNSNIAKSYILDLTGNEIKKSNEISKEFNCEDYDAENYDIEINGSLDKYIEAFCYESFS